MDLKLNLSEENDLLTLIMLLVMLLSVTTVLSLSIMLIIRPPHVFTALFILLLGASSLSIATYRQIRVVFYGPEAGEELRRLRAELNSIKSMKEQAMKKYYGKEISEDVLKQIGKKYEEQIIEKEVLINILLERGYVELVSAIIKKYVSVMGNEAIDIAKKTGIEVSFEGKVKGTANKDTVISLLHAYEKVKGDIALSLAQDAAKTVIGKNPGLEVPEELLGAGAVSAKKR